MVSDDKERFSIGLVQLSRHWRTRLDEKLRGTGLTQSRWMALVLIDRLGDGLTQRELADALMLEGASLVRILDGLENLGIVERRTDIGGDRRVKKVFLTGQAGKILEEINAIARDLRAELMQGVTEAEIRTCIKVFDAIENRLDMK